MIGRLKWCVCSLIILFLQFVVSFSFAISTAEIESDIVKAQPVLSERADQSVYPEQNDHQSIEKMSEAAPSQEASSSLPRPVGSAVSEKPNLARLMGMSDVEVMVDIDRQFLRSIAKTQVLDEDVANELAETNIFDSIRAGRKFSRESLAALARSDQAKAKTKQASALLGPSASIRASTGSETSSPSVVIDPVTGDLVASDTHTRTDITFSVRHPLFNLPTFLEFQKRKKEEQARNENYRVTDGDAYVSAVNIYLSLVSSRLQANLTSDFEAKLAELLSYIEKRANAGASSVSDMARVRARSQSTLSSRLEQESAHAAAGIEFVRLTNLVPQKVRLPLLKDVGASLLPESLDEAVAEAMESNPEIAALAAEFEASKIDRRAAKANFLPNVDLEYTDTYARGAGGSEDSQRDKRLMMALNWELFAGGKNVWYLAERTARNRELKYRLDDQRRRVIQSLLANYSVLETTHARIVSGYQELESISTAADAMSERMLSGNQSLLDLLDVYSKYHQVRIRLVDLHVFEMQAVTQIVRLTLGTPWAKGGSFAETVQIAAVSDSVSREDAVEAH